MTQSNEFTGRTLAEAVRNATAAYEQKRSRRNEDDDERERRRTCEQLERDFELFRRDLRDALHRADALQREVDSLRQSARRSIRNAVLSALAAASLGFGTAARAMRLLLRKRFKDLSRRDLLSLMPGASAALVAALSALDAIDDFEEADRLAERTKREIRSASNLTDEINRLSAEYHQAGCGQRRRPGIS